MGLFSLKNQLLKVIEWKDDSSDTIIYRFEVPDRYEIMKGSQLTVRESQVAIFVAEGKVADVFEPGRYKLDTHNLPFLTTLFNWKYAFESKYQGEVYFVNTKQFTAQKWGTTNPIMMRDKDFGMIRLRGFGQYSFRVSDAKTFMKEMAGTRKLVRTEDVIEYLKRAIVSRLSDSIGESGIAALDLAANYQELGEITAKTLSEDFASVGMELSSIHIENLSLPESVEKMMDTRTSMGVLGDMNTYTQFQAAQAIPDAAKNTGGMAGMGVGLGAGVGFGGIMANAMSGAFGGQNQGGAGAAGGTAAKTAAGVAVGAAVAAAVCPKCNAALAAGAKFCPSCGEKISASATCPDCGKPIKAGAKFCPECGASLGAKVCSCGAQLAPGAKFCPECGKKC